MIDWYGCHFDVLESLGLKLYQTEKAVKGFPGALEVVLEDASLQLDFFIPS